MKIFAHKEVCCEQSALKQNWHCRSRRWACQSRFANTQGIKGRKFRFDFAWLERKLLVEGERRNVHEGRTFYG